MNAWMRDDDRRPQRWTAPAPPPDGEDCKLIPRSELSIQRWRRCPRPQSRTPQRTDAFRDGNPIVHMLQASASALAAGCPLQGNPGARCLELAVGPRALGVVKASDEAAARS
jgi:hypothetical protein